METINKLKALLALLFAALSSWLGILTVPVLLLIGVSFADYLTGIAAAKARREQISSERGLWGIVKKVCILLLVALGAGMDWLLMFAATTVGITLSFNFFVAALVAVWLICNEIISILENMRDLGVEFPAFLLKIVETVKESAQDKAETKKGEANHE